MRRRNKEKKQQRALLFRMYYLKTCQTKNADELHKNRGFIKGKDSTFLSKNQNLSGPQLLQAISSKFIFFQPRKYKTIPRNKKVVKALFGIVLLLLLLFLEK